MNYNDLLIQILNLTPDQRAQRVKVVESDYGCVVSDSDCSDIESLKVTDYAGPVLFKY